MPNEQKNQAPSFDQFMQTCFNNPAFFESMKHFYLTQSQKASPPQPPKNESSLTQQGYQQNNSLSYSRQTGYREEENRANDYEEVNEVQPQQMKKKPANPLAKFIPSESSQA